VLGVERVGDIPDADIEGMFAVGWSTSFQSIDLMEIPKTNVLGLISMTQLLVRGVDISLFEYRNAFF
jgi:hypothetical protein